LLQGKEKWGGNDLTAMFIGDAKGVLFISDLLYSEKTITKNLGKIFIGRIKSEIKRNLSKTDLIFICMDGFMSKFLPRREFIIIPAWVLFKLDLNKSIEEPWKLPQNKSLRENLTKDPGKLKYFYRNMYLPYITGRFKELAFETGFRVMERDFTKGQLLLVKKGDDYVSGNTIKTEGDTVFFPYVGIENGKIEYLKKGAITALYYFNILWAKEGGYRSLNFGHCRSFLNDGVFNFKKRWGMKIEVSESLKSIFGIKICNYSKGVEKFLERNPFIFLDKEKLNGLIFVSQNDPISIEEVKAYVKNYAIPGLDCLVIVSSQGFVQEAREFANSCSLPRVQLVDKSAWDFQH
jgi:hypothetical protein